MNQIKDSIVIALQAIWANKLRSFMTVLGNIVAVTSIVTVVTLIQGMNAMVSEAICFRGKSALREVGKVFGLAKDQLDRLRRHTAQPNPGSGRARRRATRASWLGGERRGVICKSAPPNELETSQTC